MVINLIFISIKGFHERQLVVSGFLYWCGNIFPCNEKTKSKKYSKATTLWSNNQQLLLVPIPTSFWIPWNLKSWILLFIWLQRFPIWSASMWYKFWFIWSFNQLFKIIANKNFVFRRGDPTGRWKIECVEFKNSI